MDNNSLNKFRNISQKKINDIALNMGGLINKLGQIVIINKVTELRGRW